MAHTTINRSALVSNDVNTALTTFALQLLDAYGGLQDPGLVALGEQDVTSALNYKLPMSVGESAWQKVVNGFKYRQVGELILPVKVNDFQDGVMAEVRKLQSDAWTGWGNQPNKIAIGARVLAERVLAAAIIAGKTTPSVENYIDGDTSVTTVKVFDTAHPCDPFGGVSTTYSNLHTASPLTLANIDTIWQAINTTPAQNGVDYMNLRWTHVAVGKDLESLARRYFEDADGTGTIVDQSGSSTAQLVKVNTAKRYGIKVIASPYLNEPGVWYPICADDMGMAPWITLTQIPANPIPFIGNPAQSPDGALSDPFEWTIDDLNSELYKHGNGAGAKGHVAIAAKRTVGCAITAPWRFHRCEPT
jgi:hypothetical protein